MAGESGRWSWDASVGIDRFTQESETARNDQQAVHLRGGVKGYIVDPLVGRFRLDGEAYLLHRGGAAKRDSERYGLGTTVKLLPRGFFPIDLSFRRELYDYSTPGSDDPLTRVGAPDTGLRWSAATQLRRGALRGASFGFDRSSITFDAANVGTERAARDFFHWSRSENSLRHVLHFEHADREYGTTDLSTESYTLTLNESGSISPSWRWELGGSGFRQDSLLAAGAEQSAERYALTNGFSRSFGGSRQLELAHALNRISTNPGFWSRGQSLSVIHSTPIGAEWHLAPFARFGYRETDLGDTRLPEAGVAVAWRRNAGRVSVNATLDTSIGWIETDDGTMEERERRLGYSASGSIGGGDPQRLRTEFSLGYTGSELRLDQEPAVELPDLGFLDGVLGVEDEYSARLDLEHRNDGSSLSGWARWRRRESEPIEAQRGSRNETLTGTVQYNIRRFYVQATGGRTTVDRDGQPGQEVLHGVVTARWRPWGPLSTRLTYAVDRRMVTLGPDVDGSRLELITDLQFGNLRLEARLYETEDEIANDRSRLNRGFRWSISTRFAGWLPVFSGTRRKGVIR